MPTYGIAEAKARFSELIDRAARGEEVVIARHGKPAVRLAPAADNRAGRRITLDDLKRLRDSMPFQTVSTADIIRQQRDEGY